MALTGEAYIKMGYLSKSDMATAIETGVLDTYNVCYTRDTHECFIINEQKEPIAVKSRIPLYTSEESAIASIKESTASYAGEIISVLDGESFKAYVVNQWEDGDWYIRKVYEPTDISYDELSNIPIINKNSIGKTPIVLTDLTDGTYKIIGDFKTPDGKTITSLVGNFVIVNTEVNKKTITRINSDSMIKYTIVGEEVTTENYITDAYLQQQNFATEEYVNSSIAALDYVTHQEMAEYIQTTVTLLVRYIVEEELNSREASEQEIDDLFGK